MWLLSKLRQRLRRQWLNSIRKNPLFPLATGSCIEEMEGVRTFEIMTVFIFSFGVSHRTNFQLQRSRLWRFKINAALVCGKLEIQIGRVVLNTMPALHTKFVTL
jgi:hypothetical protein